MLCVEIGEADGEADGGSAATAQRGHEMAGVDPL